MIQVLIGRRLRRLSTDALKWRSHAEIDNHLYPSSLFLYSPPLYVTGQPGDNFWEKDQYDTIDNSNQEK